VKHRSKKTFRAAVAVISVLLSGCFLFAGMPVLATGQGGRAAGGSLLLKPDPEKISFQQLRNIPSEGSFQTWDPDNGGRA
jgi:hypothetical protein